MRTLLALLLTASMPLAGFAQSLVPATPYPPASASPQLLEQMLGSANLSANADTRAMPLWSTPDGRILTLVAAGRPDPLLPKSPQIGEEWRLIDVTPLVSGALSMKLGSNTNAYLGLGRSALLAAPLAGGCAVSTVCANPVALARGGEIRLGSNWLATGNLEFDLGYDMAWLRRDNAPAILANGQGLGAAALALPFGLSADSLADIQNASINAQGRFRWDEGQSLNLGASLGRIQMSVPGAALTSLNQAAVSFGMQHGAFGGDVTGHVLSPADPFSANALGTRVTGVDLGLSWRTPWSGMFRVGAQNLWSSGNTPYLGSGPVSREVESSQARVPYVQYRQDL